MSQSQSKDECLEQIPSAFMHFVHDGCLWAFAPERFMRWCPARGYAAKKDEWNPTPFIWDFGSRVVVPEHWLAWLREIGNEKARGIHQGKTLVFEGVFRFGERRTLVVQPEHPFRGDDLVVVMGAPFVRLWNLSVGTTPQLRPRRGTDGRELPWSGMDFREEIPIGLRFDTALPRQNITLDVEVGAPERPAGAGDKNLNSAFEVRIELRGTELVDRKNT